MIAYTKLKLTKAQYNTLTNDGEVFRKRNVLVFQFTYKTNADDYPTLRAYAMEFKHQEIPGSTPVILDYFNTTGSADLSTPYEQVTGDLQILYGELERLKRDSNPGNKEQYDYFLFTPKFDATNLHVYFEVSVVPSTNPDLLVITKSLKPSPPYGAV
ncbi:MAG: hypothetical protein ABIO81_09020 [Ginsengibacter sp.]